MHDTNSFDLSPSCPTNNREYREKPKITFKGYLERGQPELMISSEQILLYTVTFATT